MLVAGFVAVAAPIFASVYVAYHQAFDAEKKRAVAYAHDVLRRSEITTDQIGEGIKALVAAQGSDPCSAANIALMRATSPNTPISISLSTCRQPIYTIRARLI